MLKLYPVDCDWFPRFTLSVSHSGQYTNYTRLFLQMAARFRDFSPAVVLFRISTATPKDAVLRRGTRQDHKIIVLIVIIYPVEISLVVCYRRIPIPQTRSWKCLIIKFRVSPQFNTVPIPLGPTDGDINCKWNANIVIVALLQKCSSASGCAHTF